MRVRKLKLAPHKTEAVLLTTRRKLSPISFKIQDATTVPSKAIKLLGVWLDSKLNFSEHMDRTTQKAERIMTALAGLMPHIKGPRASKRRILASVVHSQQLYAAPVWLTGLNRDSTLRKMRRMQRIMSTRVCSGHRSISAEGIGVIAGIPPIDLLAKERLELYEKRERSETGGNLVRSR